MMMVMTTTDSRRRTHTRSRAAAASAARGLLINVENKLDAYNFYARLLDPERRSEHASNQRAVTV